MQIFSGPKYKHCLQKKAEEAVETVPLANSESGFYSCYFLIPKKDGGLRPIFDLLTSESLFNETAVQDVKFETRWLLARSEQIWLTVSGNSSLTGHCCSAIKSVLSWNSI